MDAVEKAVSSLRIDDRGWAVLDLRYGLEKDKKTLEQVGLHFGVTRERIRQIESNARKRLWSGTLALSAVCNALEPEAKLLGQPFDVQRPVLLRRMSSVLARAGLDGSAEARYRIVLALRSAHERYAEHWPTLTYLLCSLYPPLLDHSQVRADIAARQEAQRQWSYAELAERALRETRTPMHWHHILNAARGLRKRTSILPSGFFNTLQYRKDLFVRVGPGTYGLLDWGLKERPTNVELLADYLRKKGCAVPFAELLQKVGIPESIKTGSLQMSLDLNPRFYRSVDGAYGLRAWLPPREKQTLRIPRWKVESRDSYERVQRARDHGYDVESITARDRVKDGVG